MTRIVLALLCTCSLCSAQNLINSYRFVTAGGPIAVVSSVGAGSTNGSSITSASITTTGATLLVANVASDLAGTAPTISDSKGNTWTALTEQSNGGGGTRDRMYYVANPTVGTGHTFTLTGGSGSKPTISVAALSNVITTSPIDLSGGTTANGVTSLLVGTFTPSTNNQVVVIGGMTWNNAISSVTAGYAMLGNVSSGSQNVGGALGYLVQTTAASTSPTWTFSGSTWAAVTYGTFKQTGTVAPTYAYSDDFNRANSASLGANWTENAGDTAISSNTALFVTGSQTENHVSYNSTVASGTQYQKATVTYGAGTNYLNLIFRFTNTSTESYYIGIGDDEQNVIWYHANDFTEIQTSALTVASGDTFGVTLTGTGSSTVVRVWRNPTGLPTAADNWNGDVTPDASMTNDPGDVVDTGTSLGVSGQSDNASSMAIDNWFGGSL